MDRWVEPLELPAAGAFLMQGGRAAWVGEDTATVPVPKDTHPARGFVLLHPTDEGWRAWRLQETTAAGARSAARFVAHRAKATVVLGAVTAITTDGWATLVDAVARYDPVTSGQLLRKAIVAADEVAAEVAKATPPDPYSRRTFDRLVDELGDELGDKSDDTVERAVQQAVRKSGIDWADATEADHERFSKALAAALGVTAVAVWKAVETAAVSAAEFTAVSGAQAYVKRHTLGVQPTLARVDKLAVARAASANQFYIRDFYTNTASARLSAKARHIAAEGIAQGWGSTEIAERMYRKLGNNAAGLNRQYMQVVSSAINARARMYSSLVMMKRAGVQVYRIDSVIDDNTTDTCRFLDGKRFSVGDALARHRQIDALADPMDIRHMAPFTRERRIKRGPDKGKKGIYIPMADGDFERIAVIEKSAFGVADQKGQYSGLSTRELADRGLSFPPYHHLCRTTASPV